MPRLDAVDTSHFQEDNKPEIDFNASPSIKCWMIKATQGDKFVDPDFATNRVDMRNSGKKYRGLYHFLSSNIPVVDQYNHFRDTIGLLDPVGEFISIDAETDNNTNISVTLEQVLLMKKLLVSRYGPRLHVYTGKYVNNGRIWNSTDLFDGTVMRSFAAYTTEVRARQLALPFVWDMWQYSSDGPVPGVTGRCDMNQVDNWQMLDRICNYSTLTKENEDMKILCNKVSMDFEGAIYGPNEIKWALMDNGTKRHMTFEEYDPMYVGSVLYPLSTEQLNKIPDYKESNSSNCNFKPLHGAISLSGTIV